MPIRAARPGIPQADALELRTAAAGDMELLFGLLRAALGPWVERTYGAWNEEEQREIFFARTDPATHQVVELRGRPIGCLAVRRSPEEIRLLRVFLFPDLQNRGFGSQLVRSVLAEGEAARLPVRLRVFTVNPARHLYERLGFHVVGETETHTLMEWKPGAD